MHETQDSTVPDDNMSSSSPTEMQASSEQNVGISIDSLNQHTTIEPVEGFSGRFSVMLYLDMPSLYAQLQKAVKEKGKNFHMKGFRKGKVPFDYVMEAHGAACYEEIVKSNIGDLFDRHLKTKLTTPLLGVLDIAEQDQKQYPTFVQFKIVFEMFPQFDLESCRGLNVVQHTIETDLSHADFLDEFREIFCYLAGATFVLADESATIETYDVLKLKRVVHRKDGQAVDQWYSEDLTFPMISFAANDTDRNLYEALLGQKQGAVVQQTLSVEQESFEAEFTVLELKKAVIPELTEELVLRVGYKKGGVQEFLKDLSEIGPRAIRFLVDRQNDQRLLQTLAAHLGFRIPETVRRRMKADLWKDLNYTIKGKSLDEKDLTDDVVNKELDSVIDERFYLLCFIDIMVSQLQIMPQDNLLREYIQNQASCSWEPSVFLDRLDQDQNVRQTVHAEYLLSLSAERLREYVVIDSQVLPRHILLGYVTQLGSFK